MSRRSDRCAIAVGAFSMKQGTSMPDANAAYDLAEDIAAQLLRVSCIGLKRHLEATGVSYDGGVRSASVVHVKGQGFDSVILAEAINAQWSSRWEIALLGETSVQ